MKLAVFQMSAEGEHSDRPARIEEAMHRAAEKGADLLIAPELALSGYGRGDAFARVAQTTSGEWAAHMGRVAQAAGISLIASFPELHESAHHISALIVDRDHPHTPQVYRKGCLYGEYEKAHFTAPAPSSVIATIAGIKVGVLICYDVEFPENTRRLAHLGAQLIAVPTALPHGGPGEFIAHQVIRTRAFENQVYVAYVNHADSDETNQYQGLSSIVAPDGTVLAAAGETGDAILFAQINPDAYSNSRTINPYLSDAEAVGLI